jgi:hypothetical protein
MCDGDVRYTLPPHLRIARNEWCEADARSEKAYLATDILIVRGRHVARYDS